MKKSEILSLYCTDKILKLCLLAVKEHHALVQSCRNVEDDHSRYNIRIEPKEFATDVKTSFIAAFREYGLPNSVLSDNGSQFVGAHKGLSTLLRIRFHSQNCHLGTSARTVSVAVIRKQRLIDWC